MTLNKIAGIDPSFTGTGLCLLNLEEKTIKFKRISCEIGEKSFECIYKASAKIVKQIAESIPKGYTIISEEPIPSSIFSAGLFCLGGLLFDKVKPHYSVHPMYMAYVHKKRKYSKTDTVALAKEILELLKSKGFTVSSSRINHNEADAFLIAASLLKFTPYIGDLERIRERLNNDKAKRLSY